MNPVDFVNVFSNIETPIKGVRLPVLKIEDRHKKDVGIDNNCSNYDFLRALCKKGFLDLNLKKNSKNHN